MKGYLSARYSRGGGLKINPWESCFPVNFSHCGPLPWIEFSHVGLSTDEREKEIIVNMLYSPSLLLFCLKVDSRKGFEHEEVVNQTRLL